ncbi:hypothetical protein DICVIV_06224 [Dictyocaulus viviparus]|uniref:RPGR-interacting protein 1 first C2 domain-containing protein n=1 Tax=Dictyocaulus viviparus TaxID=29172 RepID=A0A0D8XT69_DICVI|nr:hypothetical protein DICVIV_06224 [Dictyocaulus viviparus]
MHVVFQLSNFGEVALMATFPNPCKTHSNEISGITLKDKVEYIRLNRLIREKNSQAAEMKYEINRLNKMLDDLRSQLEQKSSIISNLEAELRNARETIESDQHLNKLELISKQLAVVTAENDVLKEANERLVKQSLSIEFDESVKEQIELKKQISLLEEKMQYSERRQMQLEEALKAERRKYSKASEIGLLQDEERLKKLDSTDRADVCSVERIRKGEWKATKNKDDSDILKRLYEDVAAILNSHDLCYEKGTLEISMDSSEQVAKWKKMYAALYDELEKIRNMLLIQNDINQKQVTEIGLLQEKLDSMKTKYEFKLKEMSEQLLERQKRIFLLEEQIRSIAYATQKPIMRKVTEAKVEFSTDLSLTLTEICITDEYIKNVGTCPAYFLSLEFFDFELQTTPIFTNPSTTLDFTTIYNVVLSNLFLHFIETNGNRTLHPPPSPNSL